jgi:hypothetical protein
MPLGDVDVMIGTRESSRRDDWQFALQPLRDGPSTLGPNPVDLRSRCFRSRLFRLAEARFVFAPVVWLAAWIGTNGGTDKKFITALLTRDDILVVAYPPTTGHLYPRTHETPSTSLAALAPEPKDALVRT